MPGTTSPATFIWDTEDGTISAWTGGLNPADQAVLAIDNSAGAVYKGLVFGTNAHGVFLFATNFGAGTIDVFAPNGSAGFRPATSTEVDSDFTDPKIPAGFAPFGIQNINGDLFVTYALQDADKHGEHKHFRFHSNFLSMCCYRPDREQLEKRPRLSLTTYWENRSLIHCVA